MEWFTAGSVILFVVMLYLGLKAWEDDLSFNGIRIATLFLLLSSARSREAPERWLDLVVAELASDFYLALATIK